jgi:hypothetical protein
MTLAGLKVREGHVKAASFTSIDAINLAQKTIGR